MPLARFYQLVRVAAEQKEREEKNELEKFAWAAWQTTLPHWAKEPVMFDKWRKMLGLDKLGMPTEPEMSAEDAIAYARSIMERDTKRTVTKNV